MPSTELLSAVERTVFRAFALELLTKVGESAPFPVAVKPMFAILHFQRRSYLI